MPFDSGSTFRIWAPFGNDVRLFGDFQNWQEPGLSLSSEGNGYWSADIPGATAGQQYKFRINGNWRMDPRARNVTHSTGNCIIAVPEYRWMHGFTMPPRNELVIYQMHLGTFPDNPAATIHLFAAAVRDFGYLQELGINAIQLLPVTDFPGDRSGGYNPSNAFAVESSYGGPEGLKWFIDQAHAHGFAVILDVVYSHLGPTDTAVWQLDGWHEQWDGRDTGGIYFYNDWRAKTAWGDTRPDYGRSEVREWLRDNAMMWLHEYRADGLRFDAVGSIRTAHDRDAPDGPEHLGGWGVNVLRWINDEVNASAPWKLSIAEDMKGHEWITRPTGEGGTGFHTQWDDSFVWGVRPSLTALEDRDRHLGPVCDAIEDRRYGGGHRRIIYTESHDVVDGKNGRLRVPDAIASGQAEGWHARKKSTLGAALLFTSPGIPMIFQGQEILEWVPFSDGTRMDWNRQDRFPGIYLLYRDLIRLRRNWNNNTRGLRGSNVHILHADDDDKILVMHRWDQGGPGDDVIAVFNFSTNSFPDYRIGLPRDGAWYCRLNTDSRYYSQDYGGFGGHDTGAEYTGAQGMPFSASVAIGPYSAIIFSQ